MPLSIKPEVHCVSQCRQGRIDPKLKLHWTTVLQLLTIIFVLHYTKIYTYMYSAISVDFYALLLLVFFMTCPRLQKFCSKYFHIYYFCKCYVYQICFIVNCLAVWSVGINYVFLLSDGNHVEGGHF